MSRLKSLCAYTLLATARVSRPLPSRSTRTTVPRALLIIQYRLRCGFAQFNLCAHFLNLRRLLFELRSQLRDSGFQCLHFAIHSFGVESDLAPAALGRTPDT